MKIRQWLLWGDVAFYFGILVVAVRVAPRTTLWWAGLVSAIIAFPLWIVARVELGSSFSFRPEARGLVTTGLYSKLRHPVYVFGTVAALGALLALQIWPILAFGVALIPITLSRIRREEKLLGMLFGELYEQYRRQTWF